jgi:hypothetical protein
MFVAWIFPPIITDPICASGFEAAPRGAAAVADTPYPGEDLGESHVTVHDQRI